MNKEEFASPAPCNLNKQTVSKFAENLAKSLKYENGDNLEPLLKKLGGRITYQDIWDLESSESGSIVINSHNDFEITLARHTSKDRDRFTVAHELGHYFLHYRLPELKGGSLQPMKAARYGSDRVEYEANWFAASFLMPEESYKQAFIDCDGNHLNISEKFGVSVSASTVRARSLGL